MLVSTARFSAERVAQMYHKSRIWMIKEYGFRLWYKYERMRRKGYQIDYSSIFSPEELDKLEAAGIAPWRNKRNDK